MTKNEKDWVLIADGTFSIPLKVGGISAESIEEISRRLREKKGTTESSPKANSGGF